MDLLQLASTIPVNDTLIAGGNASFTASFTAEGTILYQWQYSTDNGNSWADVPDTLVVNNDTSYHTGANDTTLEVTNVTFDMANYSYRLVASTPSYKCGPDTPSAAASIKLAGDNDKDGIIDIIDLDDDNDGILDSIEEEETQTETAYLTGLILTQMETDVKTLKKLDSKILTVTDCYARAQL